MSFFVMRFRQSLNSMCLKNKSVHYISATTWWRRVVNSCRYPCGSWLRTVWCLSYSLIILCAAHRHVLWIKCTLSGLETVHNSLAIWINPLLLPTMRFLKLFCWAFYTQHTKKKKKNQLKKNYLIFYHKHQAKYNIYVPDLLFQTHHPKTSKF